MGLFSFLKKSKPAVEEPRLVVHVDRLKEVVSISIDWRDAKKGDVEELCLSDAVVLQELDSFVGEGRAKLVGEYEYQIPFYKLPTLEGLGKEFIGVQEERSWKVALKIRGVIGRGDPGVQLFFTSPAGEYDVLGRGLVEEISCGFWDVKREKIILLPMPLLRLRETVRRGIGKSGVTEESAIYRYLTKVKKYAVEAQEYLGEEFVKIDGQLLKEEFIAPEKVRPHIEKTDDGGLLLFPDVDGFNTPESRAQLLRANDEKELFTERENGKTTRIALNPTCRREISRIRRHHRVPPQDVPAFLNDPRTYLQPVEELKKERGGSEDIQESEDEDELPEYLISEEEKKEAREEVADDVLDLTTVEDLAATIDLSLYSDRVIGVDVTPGAMPQLQNIRTTSLGDWQGRDDGGDEEGIADLDVAVAKTEAKPSSSQESFNDDFLLESDWEEEPFELVEEERRSEEPSHEEEEGKVEQGSSLKGAGRIQLITADNDEKVDFVAERQMQLARRFEEIGGTPSSFPSHFDLIKPYQPEGYAWLRGMYDVPSDAGGLLADDMGMGKTVQVIALLGHLAATSQLKPALLVVPKSTIQNWQNEIQKFCTIRLSCYQHIGSSRLKNEKAIESNDIVITTYDTLRRDQAVLGRIRFSVMICDEAQKIKNYTSARATACRAMNAKVRVALTATPVENTLAELWSIFDFCQPGQLNSLCDFRTKFVEPIESGSDEERERASNQLIKQMGHHFLRRTKEQYLADKLPSKILHHERLPMTDVQRHKYDTIRQWLEGGGQASALGAIHAMMRVCAHPDAIEDESEEKIGLSKTSLQEVLRNPAQMVQRSSKFQYILETLREIHVRDERVILFTSLRSIQALLNAMLRHYFGAAAPLINGDVDTGTRQEILDKFNHAPGFNAIILSTRAAGVGINVTGANHVIHVTREWNPALENQATDRAYRIGQTKDVHVYIPVTTYPSPSYMSLEEHLDVLLSEKQAIADHSVVPQGLGKVSQSELERRLGG